MFCPRRRDAVRCATLVSCVFGACGWPEGLPIEGSGGDDAGSSSAAASSNESTTSSTTTGSSTSTSGVDESSNDDGVGFIMPPDGDNPNVECDLWKDDCRRGEKCVPWVSDGGNAWNATKCTPLARDPKAPGEPCTVVPDGVNGIDDCEAYAMCWDVDSETNMGVCLAFCRGSEANPICEDPNTQCNIQSDGVLILCFPFCNPLVQDCGEGQGCYPTGESFWCAADASAAAGEYGDACEFINVCDPGLLCANADAVIGCDESSGCCTPFCDLGAPACPLFTECIAWYEEGQAPPGYEDVGACVAEGA